MRRSWFLLVLVLAMLLPGIPSSVVNAAEPLEYRLANGYYFKQANGQGGQGTAGFAVTDAGGVKFWSNFQSLGGVPTLGYPISQRFVWDGMVTQAFQKVVLQWQVDHVNVINIFDEMSRAGNDGWLQTVRQVPPPADWSSDQGRSWNAVVQAHLALLDRNAAIKSIYLQHTNPVTFYGLPMGYSENNVVAVLRCQRVVIQQWKVAVPWASAGQVTIANGGDVAKEVKLLPADALIPTNMPRERSGRTFGYLAQPDAALLGNPGGAVLFRPYPNTVLTIAEQVRQPDGKLWDRIELWGVWQAWLPDAALADSPAPSPYVDYSGWKPPQPKGAQGPFPLSGQAKTSEAATLHSSADPASAALGTLPAGTTLQVLAWATAPDGHAWYQVQVGDRQGWVWGLPVRFTVEDPVKTQVGGKPIADAIKGKGMWMTSDILSRADAETVAETAAKLGITHFYIDVGHADAGFYGSTLLDKLLPAAHKHNIKVLGWLYNRLRDLPAEVRACEAAANYRTPDGQKLDGIAGDIEENLREEDVLAFSQILRQRLGPQYLMVVAVWSPLHYWGKQTPYKAMINSWNALEPMAYWHSEQRSYSAEEARAYVEDTVRLLRQATRPDMPIEVIIQAYDWINLGSNGDQSPSRAEFQAATGAVRPSGAYSVSFFQWLNATPDQWNIIGSMQQW